MASPRNERRLVNKEIARALDKHLCGSCVSCCTTMAVAEIGKPEGLPCNKLSFGPPATPKIGCTIYGKRPQSCRDWNCLWRLGLTDKLDGFKGVEGRPDQIGIVFDVNDTHATGVQMVVAREIRPGAADAAMALLHSLCALGHVIYVIPTDPNGKRRMMGPEERVVAIQEAARRRLPLVAQ